MGQKEAVGLVIYGGESKRNHSNDSHLTESENGTDYSDRERGEWWQEKEAFLDHSGCWIETGDNDTGRRAERRSYGTWPTLENRHMVSIFPSPLGQC